MSKSLASIPKQIKRHRDRIVKDRDALRLLVEEIEDFLEPTDRAIEALDDAVDALSEQG